MIEASCVVAYIDVNGIHKGPNRFEPQQFNDITGKKRKTLSGDQYYIFIGSDGVTSGNEKSNVTARVIEDLK